MNIATLGVRELRDGLSRHLAAVRDDGVEITVTDHGTPVARITRIVSESGVERLLREGLARAATAPREPLPEPLLTAGIVSDLVADQRG
ncbi:MAG: type II toxin-antitoxin system Phd/YefM family antitoxin [Microbacterium gubbeenense]|uniref:type II toxin-antitoxin system Phd/YefM family antitoxin n=1 Tax=Microbacterium gubbeenense TaxID=159896 RepID=UPI003F98ADB6